MALTFALKNLDWALSQPPSFSSTLHSFFTGGSFDLFRNFLSMGLHMHRGKLNHLHCDWHTQCALRSSKAKPMCLDLLGMDPVLRKMAAGQQLTRLSAPFDSTKSVQQAVDSMCFSPRT